MAPKRKSLGPGAAVESSDDLLQESRKRAKLYYEQLMADKAKKKSESAITTVTPAPAKITAVATEPAKKLKGSSGSGRASVGTTISAAEREAIRKRAEAYVNGTPAESITAAPMNSTTTAKNNRRKSVGAERTPQAVHTEADIPVSLRRSVEAQSETKVAPEANVLLKSSRRASVDTASLARAGALPTTAGLSAPPVRVPETAFFTASSAKSARSEPQILDPIIFGFEETPIAAGGKGRKSSQGGRKSTGGRKSVGFIEASEEESSDGDSEDTIPITRPSSGAKAKSARKEVPPRESMYDEDIYFFPAKAGGRTPSQQPPSSVEAGPSRAAMSAAEQRRKSIESAKKYVEDEKKKKLQQQPSKPSSTPELRDSDSDTGSPTAQDFVDAVHAVGNSGRRRRRVSGVKKQLMPAEDDPSETRKESEEIMSSIQKKPQEHWIVSVVVFTVAVGVAVYAFLVHEQLIGGIVINGYSMGSPRISLGYPFAWARDECFSIIAAVGGYVQYFIGAFREVVLFAVSSVRSALLVSLVFAITGPILFGLFKLGMWFYSNYTRYALSCGLIVFVLYHSFTQEISSN
jgi:hypothetical protein